MAKKFYRVIKDNPLWHVGAILESNVNNCGYRPVDETDIWDVTEVNGGEYLSDRIVEISPEYFQRVYPVNLLSKTVYKLKEEARQFYDETFNG